MTRPSAALVDTYETPIHRSPTMPQLEEARFMAKGED
jgi:hypothetical protein